MKIYPVIMAGGSGTRFWPLSRRTRPKQFLALAGDAPLLAATVSRLPPLARPAATFVVCGPQHAAAARRMVPTLPKENFIVEPCARNTAPCVGLAALHVAAKDPRGIIAMLPADHHIGNEPAFQAAVAAALELAGREDRIVTVGVRPSRPETGYGYIRTSPAPVAGPAFEVEAFVEKPDGVTARRYLESGRYLWNSGIFVWVFLGFCALIVIGQLLPAVMMILGFAKGMKKTAKVAA